METPAPSDLITAKDAAAILRCTVSTVHRWVEEGKLTEAVKLPGIRGARLFRRTDIHALVDTEDAA